MKNILVTFSNFDRSCPEAVRRLEEYGFSVKCSQSSIPYYTYEQYCEEIEEVDAIIAGLDTLDERIFSKAYRLKIVSLMGIGYDRIDLGAAKRHGIKVTTTRGGNATAVAEQTIAMIISVYRNITQLDLAMHRGEWVRNMGRELSGKTVGLVGFGAIA